jgi:hypothetical protein
VTTAELIQKLKDLDPGGTRQVVVDHDWEPGTWIELEYRDVGQSVVDGKWVVVIQKTKYGDDDD